MQGLLLILTSLTILLIYIVVTQNRETVCPPGKVIYKYIPMTYYQWNALPKNTQEKYKEMFEINPNVLRIN